MRGVFDNYRENIVSSLSTLCLVIIVKDFFEDKIVRQNIVTLKTNFRFLFFAVLRYEAMWQHSWNEIEIIDINMRVFLPYTSN